MMMATTFELMPGVELEECPKLPRKIRTGALGQVPEWYRAAYAHDGDGIMSLSDATVAALFDYAAELRWDRDSKVAEHEARKAAKEAPLKKKQDRIKSFLAKKFEAAGVTKKAFQPAVVAL